MEAVVVTETALKVDVPLVETPRPASVVEREELDERNVQSLDETFRYRAGVLSGHFGDDNDTDWFKIRGYDQSTYQDGLRVYRDGFYQWLPEPFGLSRVELLKGPASILYGETPPGGVINAISKRPTEESRGLVEVQAGNYEHRQVGIDVSGPAAGTDDVRYRMVGLFRSGEGDIDFTENERYYLAPSLEWDVTEDTELTLLSSFQKDDAVPYNGFKLPYGTVQDTPFGKVDPSTSYSEPSYDTNEREQSRIGYELDHRIDDTWRVEQRMRYSEVDLLLRSSYIAFQTGPRTGAQGLTYRDGRIDSWTLDNRVVGKWFTDRTENTLLLGLDYQDLEKQGEQANLFGTFGTIDLFDPQYGNFTPPSGAQIMDQHINKEQIGLYAQNQLRIDDRWVLLAGARHDQADVSDRVSGQEADVDETSLSAGLMYIADNGLNPYLSYTESFEPIAGTDQNGDLYDPIQGRQLEAGVKYAPRHLDGYVTAAAYRIEEENTLATTGGGAQAQVGERNTDGFEIESVAYFTEQLQATLAYTYNDSVTRNTATSGSEARAPLIPRNMASVWLDYAFDNAAPGLKIGGGVRYNGESEDKFRDVTVPSYTVLDLMARYDFGANWSAQVNVNNATDEEYVASCDYWCYYGAQRRYQASVSYRW
ncbi:TonB-dependent siderophore receptor [Halofilum ochraceum]|uniref:TonB-dependent siderophore receptor n=1 Tax=Halofilum ochraceum TaxID=1611323 RepID=UPI001C2F6FA2|nr:TonB-dependent siderophore receptor [Halofilum ochraceum]